MRVARRRRPRIPLSFPFLVRREEELVVQVLRSGRLSLGPMVERFERLLAERVQARYAAAVSSGTAGLHLAVRLAGVGRGDEVITSGGLHGKITGLTDQVVTMEIADKVRIKVQRSNIACLKPKSVNDKSD